MEVSTLQTPKPKEQPAAFWIVLGIVALASTTLFGFWILLSMMVFVLITFVILPIFADEPIRLKLTESELMVMEGPDVQWASSIEDIQDIRITHSPKFLGIELHSRFVLVQLKNSEKYSVPIREFDIEQLTTFVQSVKARLQGLFSLPQHNHGFNRTPESFGPAKPGKRGGGAG